MPNNINPEVIKQLQKLIKEAGKKEENKVSNEEALGKQTQNHSKPHNPITIGAQAIIEINGRFYLLVEIEARAPGVSIEPVVVIRISAEDARRLIKAGVRRIDPVDVIPTPPPGKTLEFKGTFIVGNDAYLIFELENHCEKLVVVRTPIIEIIPPALT